MRIYIPLRDDVAVVIGLAQRTSGKARPKNVALDGGAAGIGSRLRADRIRGIDPLHNLSVADSHIGVGRSIRHAVVGESGADAEEIGADAVVAFRAVGKILFGRIYHAAGGALGNAPDGVCFVKSIRGSMGHLRQLAERRRNSECLRMVDCVLGSERQAEKQKSGRGTQRHTDTHSIHRVFVGPFVAASVGQRCELSEVKHTTGDNTTIYYVVNCNCLHLLGSGISTVALWRVVQVS